MWKIHTENPGVKRWFCKRGKRGHATILNTIPTFPILLPCPDSRVSSMKTARTGEERKSMEIRSEWLRWRGRRGRAFSEPLPVPLRDYPTRWGLAVAEGANLPGRASWTVRFRNRGPCRGLPHPMISRIGCCGSTPVSRASSPWNL